MKNLYEKSKIRFALTWIISYVIGASCTDELSRLVNMEKSITVIFLGIMTGVAILWMKKNDLFCEFGLCKAEISPKRLLYYIPLIVIASCNLWFGVTVNYKWYITVFYILSMLLVGFLEEIIFRGFLFKMMEKNNVKSAIIVSSITFGIGHIVNLLNGADLVPTLLQICYAISLGYMFVIIFYKSKSLVPCIIAHFLINALSIFRMENEMLKYVSAVFLIVVPAAYAIYIIKKTNNKEIKE